MRVRRPRSSGVVLFQAWTCAVLAAVTVRSQQPNGAAALYVQFRQGPPFPVVATAPNDGQLTVALTGTPGAPFLIATGPLNAGALSLPGGQLWDLGTPPSFFDLTVVVDGTLPGAPPQYFIPSSGTAMLTVLFPPNVPVFLPPLQAAIIDPLAPGGFSVTAASAITLMPSKSILFIQGDYDPGLGTGPTCRLADISPLGFSALHDLLVWIGFSSATEVVDVTVTVTPQLLSPHGIVVLGTNRKSFTIPEQDAIEAFVRAGGGLVSYADANFGPGNVDSDNQILSRFGLLVAADNFGGPVVATSLVPHAISAGVTQGVGAEGVSIIEIVGNGTDVITNVAPCGTNGAACLPYPVPAPSGSPTPVYSACAAVTAGLGRVVATYDRNTFFNWPGYGSSILANSNLSYALNLFLWAGGY